MATQNKRLTDLERALTLTGPRFIVCCHKPGEDCDCLADLQPGDYVLTAQAVDPAPGVTVRRLGIDLAAI